LWQITSMETNENRDKLVCKLLKLALENRSRRSARLHPVHSRRSKEGKGTCYTLTKKMVISEKYKQYSVQWTRVIMIACARHKCSLAVKSSKVVSSPANSTFALSVGAHRCASVWLWNGKFYRNKLQMRKKYVYLFRDYCFIKQRSIISFPEMLQIFRQFIKKE